MSIILKGISKAYGENQVFSDITMEFKDGGNYCLMGPSGFGKTTLLHIIMGLIKPDSGAVSGMAGRMTAPVFQEERLCENLSAGANIRMASRKKLQPQIISETLDSLLLPGILHQPVRELSGGMKRRVSIARALLCDGDIFIFDEPFRELDEKTKRCVMDSVARARGNKTLLWVTHNPSEAEYMKSEIISFPPNRF